jgi:hypothetical protein
LNGEICYHSHLEFKWNVPRVLQTLGTARRIRKGNYDIDSFLKGGGKKTLRGCKDLGEYAVTRIGAEQTQKKVALTVFTQNWEESFPTLVRRKE